MEQPGVSGAQPPAVPPVQRAPHEPQQRSRIPILLTFGMAAALVLACAIPAAVVALTWRDDRTVPQAAAAFKPSVSPPSVESSDRGIRDPETGDYMWERPEYADYFDMEYDAYSEPPAPAYTILNMTDDEDGDRIVATDVLVDPSDAEVTGAELEALAKAIGKDVADPFHEGLSDHGTIRLFATRDAYIAARDAGFNKDHPEALRRGFLGILTAAGDFRTAKELHWNPEVPR